MEVVSQLGGPFRLANPWPGRAATLYREGKRDAELSGDVLSFATSRGETVVVVPKGTAPQTMAMN